MDEDFQKIRERKRRAASGSGRIGVLNLALLFAVAAIALSLVLTPMLSDGIGKKHMAFQPPEVDSMSTGSIPVERDASGKRYTIRRSILQSTPGSVCIIDHVGGDSC
ncbi:hypothetical protein [Rhizobium paknamense]|uniref:Uncharacterized protein n=1 Tax=Rhizobium paknamense TaxID=1206817 RepID=A0ABU0IGI0_9HYPH|nr:hypothetical protein [Rhizobium paknamense]MDQ0456515.1 hypothetical protein [Rhizobium paknamense]